MLKVLLPTTFPTAMSRCPFTAAATDAATSGSEVPAATIVRPMTSSDTPSSLAMSVAAPTNQRDPMTRATRPTTIRPSWAPSRSATTPRRPDGFHPHTPP